MFYHGILEARNPLNTGFYGSSILNCGQEGNNLQDEEYENGRLDNAIDNFDSYELYADYETYRKNVTIDVNNYFVHKINEIAKELIGINELINPQIFDCELVCPKYYNFETDRAYFRFKILGSNWAKFVNYLYKNHYDEIDKLILKRFTSRDGFISHHTNDIDSWIANKFEFGEDRYKMGTYKIGFLLECLLRAYYDNWEAPMHTFDDLYEICENVWAGIDKWYEKNEEEYDFIDGRMVQREPFKI